MRTAQRASSAQSWTARHAARLITGLAALLSVGCGPAPDSGEDDANPADAVLVCDRDYAPAFNELVSGASERIDILQWELFDGSATDSIVDLLGDAADRGVAVRVLLDEEIEENEDGVSRLTDRGVDARLDDNGGVRLHAKLVVADDARALVGSTNWSTASIQTNRECNLRLESASSVPYLSAWLDRLWNDSSGRQTPEIEQVDVDHHQALVDDELMAHLLERLDNATERVDFTLYATWLQPTNPDAPAMQVFSALAEAASSGVAVRGIVDWSDWNADNNASNLDAVDWLEARGVDMRWELPDVVMHAKTFLVDGGLQVQTANVSSGGFAYNHEAGAWTTEQTVLDDFDSWFETLWAEGSDAPPGR